MNLSLKANRLSADEIAEYKEAFQQFDLSGNGKITKDEIRNVIKTLNQEPDEDEIDKIMESMDEIGRGYINFDQFLEVMVAHDFEENPEEIWRLTFNVFDRNGDGAISHTELKIALKSLDDLNMTNEEINEMIKEVDKDGDGQIDYKEFMKMMKERN